MLRAIVDTHAAIWYIYDDPRLSTLARATIEGAAADGDTVGVSSISLMEMVYLTERGRIPVQAITRLVEAMEQPDAVLEDIPITRQLATALAQVSRAQVPDMPDRIITATALAASVPLISRDGRIKFSGIATIW